MKIEDIIYDTTRSLFDLSQKLSITTLCIVSYEMGAEQFSQLLYGKDFKAVMDNINNRFHGEELLKIDLTNSAVVDSLGQTIDRLKIVYDASGFYKALYNKDSFAVAIVELAMALQERCPQN